MPVETRRCSRRSSRITRVEEANSDLAHDAAERYATRTLRESPLFKSEEQPPGGDNGRNGSSPVAAEALTWPGRSSETDTPALDETVEPVTRLRLGD